MRQDSPLINKGFILPRDLVGIPLILPLGDFAESRLFLRLYFFEKRGTCDDDTRGK